MDFGARYLAQKGKHRSNSSMPPAVISLVSVILTNPKAFQCCQELLSLGLGEIVPSPAYAGLGDQHGITKTVLDAQSSEI